MNSFVKLFPTQTFLEVLILFISHPEEEFTQSEIVTSTGKALMQIQRSLKRLEETELIKKRIKGNRNFYFANRHFPAFEDIKRALYKTVLVGDSLRKAIKPLKNKIQFGFIYGSVAKGEESSNSDIDIFIVGELSLREVVKCLSPLSKILGKEINPSIYPLDEFLRKLKENNSFLKDVFQSPKIWLIGSEYEFGKVA